MQANQQLSFLQDKIRDIGTAIFFNLSDSVLKLPTSIIQSLKVDDLGFIWFYMQKPKQELREFDKEFPVRLDFFRKGKNYFLQVVGKARMVDDPEEINSLDALSEEEKSGMKDMVLIKVKMLKAEYHETGNAVKAAKSSWWQSAMSSLYTWFRSSHGTYQPEVFNPVSLN
jgi:general stress protein 26